MLRRSGTGDTESRLNPGKAARPVRCYAARTWERALRRGAVRCGAQGLQGQEAAGCGEQCSGPVTAPAMARAGSRRACPRNRGNVNSGTSFGQDAAAMLHALPGPGACADGRAACACLSPKSGVRRGIDIRAVRLHAVPSGGGGGWAFSGQSQSGTKRLRHEKRPDQQVEAQILNQDRLAPCTLLQGQRYSRPSRDRTVSNCLERAPGRSSVTTPGRRPFLRAHR